MTKLVDIPMHVFPRDVQTELSVLSKTLYNAIGVSKPRPMNPILSIMERTDAENLHKFMQTACVSHSMHSIVIANSMCRIHANARLDYMRASLQLAIWKSSIHFEMILANKAVYFNIKSDFTRVNSIFRLVAGLIIMMWKNSLVNKKEVTELKLVISSSVPLLYIHKMRVDSTCREMTQFLQKHISQAYRKVDVHLLNCI
jgi:hypothetical protein